MPSGMKHFWQADVPPSLGVAVREPALLDILLIRDWWRFVAETLIILVAIYLLQIWSFRGAGGSMEMPHPFWIPVVLVSCQYGVMGGIFAALASTAAYLSSDAPQQTAAQDFYAHAGAVSALPAGWIAVALLIGGLRSLQISQVYELKHDLGEMRSMAETIASGLDQAVKEISSLELRIATDNTTVSTLTQNISELDVRDQRAALDSYARLIRAATGSQHVAIYLSHGDGFQLARPQERAPGAQIHVQDTLTQSQFRDLQLASAAAKTLTVPDPLFPPSRRRIGLMKCQASGRVTGVIVCDQRLGTQEVYATQKRLDDLARGLSGLLELACLKPTCSTKIAPAQMGPAGHD
jgi:hypothetical protein